LDDVQAFVEKLSRIFANNDIRDLTLLRMEVPCCGGLRRMVTEALKLSGKKIPVQEYIVERHGKVTKADA
jgi:hypothetical protein